MAPENLLALCEQCRGPMPPAATTGRPRRFCSDKCRNDARHRRNRDRAGGAWATLGAIASTLPPDPVTQRLRSHEALERILEGAGPAPALDRLVAVIVELQSLTFTVRQLAGDLPEHLHGRTADLADRLARSLRATFGEVL